ncbi:preprotein translocase subunit SecG [Planctomyces sp. SH-PL62]|uniref:preprotein translocase subunit SecG n=1 Tax=Planctomyces sp. SH-PL62 TaxID=1636152 RepID=UPI00078B1F5F|nr:preprotein translocase subunit SecG [Planctomyces sp. SH-PL62]AMV40312.1 preprotein translocase subunit SecG [Planctomyces sp. SH-PL62]
MGVLTSIFNTLLVLLSLFLICLVLIQRGKGGGLAGAFGGAGGSSAFGTKAGDTFTRITIVTASIWILMTMLLVILTSNQQGSSIFDDAPTSLTRDLTPKTDVPPVPSPVDGAAAAASPASAEAAAPTAPAENVPAIPPTSNFPLTPGNEPPPTPK